MADPQAPASGFRKKQKTPKFGSKNALECKNASFEALDVSGAFKKLAVPPVVPVPPPPRLSDPGLSLSFVYRMSFWGVIKRVISPYNKSDCLFYCMYLGICKT